MTTRVSSVGNAALFVAAVALGGLLTQSAGAQTTFDSPPSVGALESALGIAAPPKHRSLVIDQGESSAPAYRPAAAAPPPPAPANTGMAAAVPARPVPHAPAAQAPATQAPATQASASAAVPGEKSVGMRIPFDYDSATIRAESEAFISPLAEILKKNPQVQVVIVGHTDATGSYSYNMQLSQRRAVSVRDDLVNHYGIDGSRLSAVGKGPTELQLRDDPTNPANRRVEFKLRNL